MEVTIFQMIFLQIQSKTKLVQNACSKRPCCARVRSMRRRQTAFKLWRYKITPTLSLCNGILRMFSCVWGWQSMSKAIRSTTSMKSSDDKHRNGMMTAQSCQQRAGAKRSTLLNQYVPPPVTNTLSLIVKVSRVYIRMGSVDSILDWLSVAAQEVSNTKLFRWW